MGFSLGKVLGGLAGPIVGIATGNPLLGALAGGIGGAASGGGALGALAGGAGGYFGGGGSLGSLGSLVPGKVTSPLDLIKSGVANVGKNLGTGSSSLGLGDILKAGSKVLGATNDSGGGSLSTLANLINAGASIYQGLDGYTPQGAYTQQEIKSRIGELEGRDALTSQKYINAMETPGLSRVPTGGKWDYYRYGEGPQMKMFFDPSTEVDPAMHENALTAAGYTGPRGYGLGIQYLKDNPQAKAAYDQSLEKQMGFKPSGDWMQYSGINRRADGTQAPRSSALEAIANAGNNATGESSNSTASAPRSAAVPIDASAYGVDMGGLSLYKPGGDELTIKRIVSGPGSEPGMRMSGQIRDGSAVELSDGRVITLPGEALTKLRQFGMTPTVGSILDPETLDILGSTTQWRDKMAGVDFRGLHEYLPGYAPKPVKKAHGGVLRKQGALAGMTHGQDDDVPAMLSDGEYVIPADVVSHLGDGNTNAGASTLDKLIKNVRKSKGMKNKLPPKAKSVDKYMKKASK